MKHPLLASEVAEADEVPNPVVVDQSVRCDVPLGNLVLASAVVGHLDAFALQDGLVDDLEGFPGDRVVPPILKVKKDGLRGDADGLLQLLR